MKKGVNVDLWAGLFTLAVTGLFWMQILERDEFSFHSLIYPDRILPILGILGAVLVIKGFVKPTRKVEFCKELNTELVFTAVVSAIWVLAMDYFGFLLTSTVAMFLMLYRFQPKELRSAKSLLQFCLIIFGELAFMWVVFVNFLAVSLPEGQFFRMIGLA